MTAFDFDDWGRAHVPEQEFTEYLSKNSYPDDYTKMTLMECQVAEKDWRMCNCLVYYNGGGCALARYNVDYGYGELL